MTFTLRRLESRKDGIFGELLDEEGDEIAVTLEHAYENGDGSYFAKIPAGQYSCKRGLHQLLHMVSPFETFQVCDVPGHNDILFHVGNRNDDSEGCVLLGTETTQIGDAQIITGSKLAFQRFMKLLAAVNRFDLVVQDIPPDEA